MHSLSRRCTISYVAATNFTFGDQTSDTCFSCMLLCNIQQWVLKRVRREAQAVWIRPQHFWVTASQPKSVGKSQHEPDAARRRDPLTKTCGPAANAPRPRRAPR